LKESYGEAFSSDRGNKQASAAQAVFHGSAYNTQTTQNHRWRNALQTQMLEVPDDMPDNTDRAADDTSFPVRVSVPPLSAAKPCFFARLAAFFLPVLVAAVAMSLSEWPLCNAAHPV
jgi:hypothetical protein